MAPEVKAVRVLPSLFPRAAKALPAVVLPEPATEDITRFTEELRAAFARAPAKRGVGP